MQARACKKMTDLHEIVDTFYLTFASELRRVLWLILKLLQISRTENCPFPPSYLQTNLIAAQKTNFSLQNCDSGSPVRGHKFWPDGARDVLSSVPGSQRLALDGKIRRFGKFCLNRKLAASAGSDCLSFLCPPRTALSSPQNAPNRRPEPPAHFSGHVEPT